MDGKSTDLTGVEVVDDLTFKVTLTEPSPLFLQRLGIDITWVVPSESVVPGKPEWVANPVGAGPFKFVSWEPNVKIVLEANPDYFLGKPAIDRIEYLIVPDSATAMAMYEAGEVDITDVPASELQRLSQDPTLGAELNFWTRAQIRYVGMNQSVVEQFKDQRVRMAFNLAVDRKTLVESVLNSAWATATGMVPPHVFDYNPDLKGLPYDPEKAKALMAEAGFPDGQGFPSLQIATLARDATMAEAIAAQLTENLGVQVEVLQLERGDMIDGLWAHDKWQMFFFGWSADSPTANVFLYELLYGGLDSNFSVYANSDYDALIDQARASMDPEAAKGFWQKAEQMAVDDAAMIPIGYPQFIYLVKPYVSGFSCSLFGPVNSSGITINR
jgi:peptide/nickel transport system substrate-binding protein